MQDTSLITHFLTDICGDMPGLTAKPMFGGYGLRLNGTNCGIFDDGIAYLKVTPVTQPEFEAQGGYAFTYPKKNGGTATMKGYWSIPDAILDDRQTLRSWIERAAGQ